MYPEYIPINPINVFSFLENDDDKFHSKYIKPLIKQCDEMWFFGDWLHSKQCLAERSYADINCRFENFSFEANKSDKNYQFRNWVDLNLYNNKFMTNYEKIKDIEISGIKIFINKSKDEIANFLINKTDCDFCPVRGECNDNDIRSCEDEILKWLEEDKK